MTPWTSSFIDLQWRAKQFEGYYRNFGVTYCQTAARVSTCAAIVRKDLMIALAVYRVELKKRTTA